MKDGRFFAGQILSFKKTPERVKDELVTFLGYSPALTYIDNNLPGQKGAVFELREHQEEALASLSKMREEGKTIALVQGATGSGKSAIGVLDAKNVGGRVLFLAHTKELVKQGAGNFESLWNSVSVGRFMKVFTILIRTLFAAEYRASSAILTYSNRMTLII